MLGVHQWEVLSLFLIGDIPPNTPQYPYLCRRHGPGPKGPGLWALRDIGGALGGIGGVGEVLGVIVMSMVR